MRQPSRAAKTEHVGMAMHDVAVRRVQRLSPHMVRITLGGATLADFLDDGPDQRFKLLLPAAGQDRPILPPLDTWYDDWRAMPERTRPIMRTYTVRTARPESAELDVDIVLHGDAGPASAWAMRAAPGDRVGLLGAWAEYEAPPAVRFQLIAGDLTALPAVAAIVERLAPEAVGRVVLEVDPADRSALDAPRGVQVDWVDPGRAPGCALIDAVRAVPPFEVEHAYAWVAGERLSVAALRRHLVQDRGLAPTQVMFMGYWRTDGAIG